MSLIYRDISKDLLAWKISEKRKPMILRGARQVGKTTIVNEFGKSYDQYLYFNLELQRDLDLFTSIETLDSFIEQVSIARGIEHPRKITTLFFIDEVQAMPKVIEALRYFYEEHNYIHVIVTGSLLEFGIKAAKRIPVGRVEFIEMFPVTFREYLNAVNPKALDSFQEVPYPTHLNSIILKRFHEYAMIGGMPEVVKAYIDSGSLTSVIKIYDSIMDAYIEDVEKYANTDLQRNILRHIINNLHLEVDNRISMSNFAGSSYRSREVKEAMSALEKARLVELIYPTSHTAPPIYPNLRKKPRLLFLDVGLINNRLGIQSELLTISDLHQGTRGKLIEQVVNQELKALSKRSIKNTGFWVREESDRSAEVDIVYQYRQYLIPIEIKSGATGRLRSLHEYMDRCDHTYAVRLYAGELKIDVLQSRTGKSYHLLNLPYFLGFMMERYLEWFIGEVE